MWLAAPLHLEPAVSLRVALQSVLTDCTMCCSNLPRWTRMGLESSSFKSFAIGTRHVTTPPPASKPYLKVSTAMVRHSSSSDPSTCLASILYLAMFIDHGVGRIAHMRHGVGARCVVVLSRRVSRPSASRRSCSRAWRGPVRTPRAPRALPERASMHA